MATQKATDLLLDCFICGRRREQNNPRLLTCKHSFCLSCLTESTPLLKEDRIQCPICWQHTPLGEQGVQGLPHDDKVIVVENAITFLKTVNVCLVCAQSAKGQEACVRCNNCQLRLCQDCAKQHKDDAKFSGHLIEENVCDIHIRDLTHACLTCSMGMCFECVVSPFHEDHVVCDIIDVKEKTATLMAQGKRILQEEIQTVDQLMHTVVDKSLRFLAERRKDTEEKLERYKKELFQAIKESMEARAETFHKSVIKSLEKQQEACSNASNCVNDLTFTDEGKYRMLHTLTKKRFDLFQALKALRCSNPVNESLPKLEHDVCVTEKDKDNKHYEFKCTVGKFISDTNSNRSSTEADRESRPRCKNVLDLTKKPVKRLSLDKLPNKGNITYLWYVAALPDRKAIIGGHGWKGALEVDADGTFVNEYSYPDMRNVRGMTISNGIKYIGDKYGKVISVGKNGEITSIMLNNMYDFFDIAVHEEDLLVKTGFGNLENYTLTGQWRKTFANGGFGYITAAEHPILEKVYLASEEGEGSLHVYSMQGKLIRKIGKKGTGDGQFQDIKGSCMLPNGNIIIPDSEMNRITEFTFDGQFVRHLLNQGDGLKTPYSVSFNQNCLWVACKNILFMFEYN